MYEVDDMSKTSELVRFSYLGDKTHFSGFTPINNDYVEGRDDNGYFLCTCRLDSDIKIRDDIDRCVIGATYDFVYDLHDGARAKLLKLFQEGKLVKDEDLHIYHKTSEEINEFFIEKWKRRNELYNVPKENKEEWERRKKLYHILETNQEQPKIIIDKTKEDNITKERSFLGFSF